MSPENGATMGFFPVDAETLRYLRLTGRDEAQVALVEAYCKAQGLWRDAGTPPAEFTATLEIDLSAVEPSVAGPSRPQDRVPLREAPAASRSLVPEPKGKDGDVVIAAITSCTNTSNPTVMIGAASRAQRGSAGAEGAPRDQDLALARLARGGRLPGEERTAGFARRARLPVRRLRLHDLHGQFGPLPAEVAERWSRA